MAEEATNGASAGVAISGVFVQVSVPASKAEEAVTFYKAAFGAEEVRRSSCSKRKADQEQPALLCAELKIGSASFLICGQIEDSTVVKGEVAPVLIRVQVDDVEGAVSKAVQAGAQLQGEISEDEAACGGGALGKLVDPFGVSWAVIAPAKVTEVEA
ncbi:Glyoxalase/bleomycin resistance protein/dioxygenase [Rhynchospora pubera]|uniref:Glyoxalase/bleomycin resistance protein/dioxygenase n=1 Tax=Rhynchospora pubera TaxID=906938 RepID=A0AAV8HMP0_9POAL|nr:Glyoxalase/bleomycin resistance protein/dioxygenase [Rhynchospora pubera]KAJ4818899.1 Glyoxalase/bleomycin resistance protein/dioxygenase [Rhynchospora pubera]